MPAALILDFDASVWPLPGARAIPLGHWQEAIRFGCSMRALRALEREVDADIVARPPVVFMGSGDYHHVSYLLIERLRSLNRPVQIVVFDNHPDNMRYPFGIHCGSWVWHVSRLPFVARVHVAGLTSTDVEGAHVWENHLGPLYSGKVHYWCVQRGLRAMRFLGVRNARSFPSTAAMVDGLRTAVMSSPEPVYLSIDKDVLARDAVQTNWDQGVMRLDELEAAIGMLRERIVASDVVGDVSSYRYRSRFKRFLSRMDGQPEVSDHSLREWQERHQQVNAALLPLLSATPDSS